MYLYRESFGKKLKEIDLQVGLGESGVFQSYRWVEKNGKRY
ncbi:hypothetical protein D1AOALGA4SA_12742 [Olavius algarvensis Delta 1 endosymbiont]|nr:hypothetical protein D1AOALGA4SA_12742 [Olavius algarvensis Delta 1 endosymbiont]